MNEIMDSNYTKFCSLRYRIIMLLFHKESAGLQKPKHATGAPFCITSSSIVHILNPKGLPHIIFFVLRILTRRPLILKKSILQLLDDCTIKYRWIASLVMPSVLYKKPSSAMRCTEMYDMLTHNEHRIRWETYLRPETSIIIRNQYCTGTGILQNPYNNIRIHAFTIPLIHQVTLVLNNVRRYFFTKPFRLHNQTCWVGTQYQKPKKTHSLY